MSKSIALPVKRSSPVMGSVASIHVYDAVAGDLIEAVIAEVFSELGRYEELFSTYRSSSEISRINRKELHLLEASREVIDVLDACFYLEGASGGAFSSRRLDGSIDPAGFVKGWAVERSSRRFDAAGIRNWYVSLGGDMQMGDPPFSGNDALGGWKVGIADPSCAGEVVAGLCLKRGAVATSGTSERGRHLIDPRSGEACHYWSSLTVVGPSLTWADAFATTAFVLGEDGIDWVHQFEGYAVLGIKSDGSTVTVPH